MRSLPLIVFPILYSFLFWGCSSFSQNTTSFSPIIPNVYSGPEPDSQIFEALQRKGVKTIISVDGKRPDVQQARQIGAQYIHLPIGYDGISEERGAQLSYALQSSPRPLYIHCHHGKHRGPAALAYALITSGEISQSKGAKFLKLSGTSPDYYGLWEAVKSAKPLKTIQKTSLPSAVAVSSLASQMVRIGEYFDGLKLLQKNNWRPSSEHPDLSPTQQSLLLWEAFRELNRAQLPSVTQHPQMVSILKNSEHQAYALHKSLKASASSAQRDKYFAHIKQDCRACHTQYRN